MRLTVLHQYIFECIFLLAVFFQTTLFAVSDYEFCKPAPPDSSLVRQHFNDFIDAFDKLNWDKFLGYFANDATVFFFFDNNPQRADGKPEIEKMFKAFFDNTRKTGKGPSYLHLNPENIKIQMPGNEAAVISFYIKGKFGLGRRTLVFQKIKGKWMIIHLHASNLAQQEKR